MWPLLIDAFLPHVHLRGIYSCSKFAQLFYRLLAQRTGAMLVFSVFLLLLNMSGCELTTRGNTHPWAKSALVHMKFDLILLHPALFLPRGQHLVALKTHEPPTYADWAVIDRELRERNSPSDSDSERL